MLTGEMKKRLCKEFNFTDRYNRPYGFGSIKRILLRSGYAITESTIRINRIQHRVVFITQ